MSNKNPSLVSKREWQDYSERLRSVTAELMKTAELQQAAIQEVIRLLDCPWRIKIFMFVPWIRTLEDAVKQFREAEDVTVLEDKITPPHQEVGKEKPEGVDDDAGSYKV